MESISRILNPYKDAIGLAASIVTIAQFFSGVFICNDIRKKGDTKGISSTPFVGGVVVGIAMLRYGDLLSDNVMIQVNLVAIVLNILYCLFYYIYSKSKWDELLKPLSVGVGIVAVLYRYTTWESPLKVEYRYGMIVTIMMLLLLGAPLMGLGEIVRKKDATSIPFVLTLMGTIVTFLWLLYALVIENNFMIVQNVVGFMLCFVQLTLIFVFPAKEGKKKKGLKKE